MKLDAHTSIRSIHHPVLRAAWNSNTEALVWLEWSDGYGDPVWSIDLTFDPPAWLAHVIDWLDERPRRRWRYLIHAGTSGGNPEATGNTSDGVNTVAAPAS